MNRSIDSSERAEQPRQPDGELVARQAPPDSSGHFVHSLRGELHDSLEGPRAAP